MPRLARASTHWPTVLRLLLASLVLPVPLQAQAAADTGRVLVLAPDGVWDGTADPPRRGWVVIVRGERIEAVGSETATVAPAGAQRIALAGTTLIPGLIEGHSHLFLHPYNEALWDDQVLREPLGLRIARAVAHAAATLRAGVTTERDLGTEGALDNDVQLRRAIEQGIVPGPRLIAVTRAIVATGSYAPARSHYAFDPPQGAEEADGEAAIVRVVRSQVGRGADWIKVYADYGWGPGGALRPTFSQQELDVLVATARAAGRPVAAHAMTPEGMRRAVLAGVETIEHGDEGTPEVFRLMRQRGVALCPTLAAGEAYATYFDHWVKGRDAPIPALVTKRASFRMALEAGVPSRVQRGPHRAGPAGGPGGRGGRSHPRHRGASEGADGDEGRSDGRVVGGNKGTRDPRSQLPSLPYFPAANARTSRIVNSSP
jgi:imidazolonepropionase-like amidohydrolase